MQRNMLKIRRHSSRIMLKPMRSSAILGQNLILQRFVSQVLSRDAQFMSFAFTHVLMITITALENIWKVLVKCSSYICNSVFSEKNKFESLWWLMFTISKPCKIVPDWWHVMWMCFHSQLRMHTFFPWTPGLDLTNPLLTCPCMLTYTYTVF